MRRHTLRDDYEGIKIDVCNKCTGVWLDAGELAQIAAKDEEGSGWLADFLSRSVFLFSCDSWTDLFIHESHETDQEKELTANERR